MLASSTACLPCDRSPQRGCFRRTHGNAGSSWLEARPLWVSETADGRMDKAAVSFLFTTTAATETSSHIKDKFTLLYPNLSGEPPLDLASLQPSVHFVLGCGEESTFHEIGKHYR